jgi:hypothetical protein
MPKLIMSKQILVILGALAILSGCKESDGASNSQEDYPSQECWTYDAFGLGIDLLVGGFNNPNGFISTCDVLDPDDHSNELEMGRSEDSLDCEVTYNGGTFIVDAYEGTVKYSKDGHARDGDTLEFDMCTQF